MPRFTRYVGIDYSGANQPGSAVPGIKVFTSGRGNPPEPWPRLNRHHQPLNWSRRALAERLVELLTWDQGVIVGIDHAFSFPRSQIPPNLEAYMSPPLTELEWQLARFEGWILGIR
jgi:hypothetical protein